MPGTVCRLAEVGQKMTIETICENREFRRLYARGKSYVTPLIVVYAMKNRQKQVRMGITTTKKIGNAVKRSRCRRVIREAFRAVAEEIPTGWSFVLVARVKTAFVKSGQVERDLHYCLKKAGLLQPEKEQQKEIPAGEEKKEMPQSEPRAAAAEEAVTTS